MNCHYLSVLLKQEHHLAIWLEKAMGADFLSLRCEPLSGDASFRRYYRLFQGERSFMLAIAPPTTEKNREFVAIAQLLNEADVLAPQVLDVSYEHGFILQQDLGDQILQPLLRGDAADLWYERALEQLFKFSNISCEKLGDLAVYNEALLQQEMALLTEWFIPQLLGLTLSADEEGMLAQLFECLTLSALDQPQVFVHRDYHCRNLMAVNEALAVIDFQDAVVGPITYDAVSLLKDCYIVWPKQWVEGKLKTLYLGLSRHTDMSLISWDKFQRSFHLMGLQRHIKVLGIFARLSLRDNKHGYLRDLPTVVRYVSDAAALYGETADFKQWFDERIVSVCKAQPWWNESAEPSL